MAIRPRFAESILAGRKRVEFRKRRFSRDVSHVIMYVTEPVQRVLGMFEVKSVSEGTPARVWRRYQGIGGIARDEFWGYYGTRRSAVAIEVGRVFSLCAPAPLSKLGRGLIPPQSFRYVAADSVDKLLGECRSSMPLTSVTR